MKQVIVVTCDFYDDGNAGLMIAFPGAGRVLTPADTRSIPLKSRTLMQFRNSKPLVRSIGALALTLGLAAGVYG